MKRLSQTQISEINITPLTDVFLVLLIIMMLVTPMMNFAGLPLSMSTSQGDSNPKDKKLKTLTVRVDAEGKFTVEKVEIPRTILGAELRARLADNPDGVAVQVHPNAPYDALTFALGAVYQAGIQRVKVFEEKVSDAEGAKPAPPAKS